MPDNQDAPLKTYIDHLERGELAYQFSPDMGKAVFYPRVLCPFTGSDRLEWRISKGLGTVHATTVVHPGEGKPFTPDQKTASTLTAHFADGASESHEITPVVRQYEVQSISGLPHHSTVPRTIALVLAGGIVVLGVWVSLKGADQPTDRRSAEQRLRLPAFRTRHHAFLARHWTDPGSARG